MMETKSGNEIDSKAILTTLCGLLSNLSNTDKADLVDATVAFLSAASDSNQEEIKACQTAISEITCR